VKQAKSVYYMAIIHYDNGGKQNKLETLGIMADLKYTFQHNWLG
jgi:hypothetical protein